MRPFASNKIIARDLPVQRVSFRVEECGGAVVRLVLNTAVSALASRVHGAGSAGFLRDTDRRSDSRCSGHPYTSGKPF